MRRLVLVVGIVALGASACGRGTSNQSGFLSEAASHSVAAGTARMSITFGGFPRGSDIPPSFAGQGEVDFTRKVVHITFRDSAHPNAADAEEVLSVGGTTYTPLTPAAQKELKTKA